MLVVRSFFNLLGYVAVLFGRRCRLEDGTLLSRSGQMTWAVCFWSPVLILVYFYHQGG